MGSLEFHSILLAFFVTRFCCVSQAGLQYTSLRPLHQEGSDQRHFPHTPQLNELYSLFSSQKLLRGNYSRASKLVLTALFFSSVSHQILPEDFQVPAPLACSLPFFPKL